MQYSDDVEDILRHLFFCKRTHESLELHNSPASIIESTKRSIKKKEVELNKLGLDNVAIKNALLERWLHFSAIEMDRDRKGECYLNAKIMQDSKMKDSCMDSMNCLDCLKYKEMTEEQLSNFFHGIDIDTGEDLGFIINEGLYED